MTSFLLRAAVLLLPAAAGAQMVSADSEVLRILRARPVPAGFHELLVARETFRLAGERKAAQAVDDYLARAGLLALAGEPVPRAGTIGDLVSDSASPPALPDGLAARVLRSALHPRPAGPAEKADGRHQVRIDIENIGGKPIANFDAGLRIDLDGDARILLPCRPAAPFERLAPGEARRHVCVVPEAQIPLPALAKAVDAAQLLPERWRLMPTRIAFAEPAVNFGSRGIYFWLDTDRAARDAAARLHEAGCRARGSCLADLRRHLESSPALLYAIGGLLVAASAAWLLLRSRRRH